MAGGGVEKESAGGKSHSPERATRLKSFPHDSQEVPPRSFYQLHRVPGTGFGRR